MSLTASIKAFVTAKLTRPQDQGTAAFPLSLAFALNLADGVGANQADRIWADTRTLGASATEDLDLAGVLTDVYGQAFTLARLKALLITAPLANLNNINVSRPAVNGVPIYLAAGDGEVLHPGGVILKVWPGLTAIPVTAATADLLTITNAAGVNSVTYNIALIGASS